MSDLIDPELIRRELQRAGLAYVQDLNPSIAPQLSLWLNLLLRQPRNLTSVRTPRTAIAKHVIEPLTGRHRLISADLPVPHGPIIDIGSGNGAPGLPIALCEPDRQATLLESRTGAAAFLQEVITEVEAPQISAIHARAEIAAHSTLRTRFALALTRATAPPAAAMELVIPFLQVGGIAAAWTGELSETDAESVSRVLEVLGAELTPIDPPPDIIVATKIRPTDDRYPRSWNQIRRRPPSRASRASRASRSQP